MEVNIDRLRRKIAENGLTMTQLAEQSEISESTLYRILSNGTVPKYTTLEQIAAPLNTTVDWLTSTEPEIDPIEPEINPADPAPGSELTEPVKNEVGAMKELFIRQLQMMNEQLEYSRKQFRAACVVILALMAFICSFFAIDLINPGIGWLRK